MIPELEEMPLLLVALAVPDEKHWNIVNDPIYPKCLSMFKARHEASLASGTTKPGQKPGSHGESSTSAHDSSSAPTPQPLATPALSELEVKEQVIDILNQMHSLRLETAGDGLHLGD